MTTLHDRLADLADTAPRGLPEPDLWGRGRRYGRRRRAGTVVVVAVTAVLLCVIVGVSELRSRPTVEPASPSSQAALPTRLVHPSAWLDGTDDAGALGQLAAVYGATRGGWTGASYGFVGISAVTGEYRFLDLPDLVDDEIALAPDGRHVAYWYTGDTQLSPHSDSGPVVGVAVYDTTTGEVVRLPIPSDHGLMVDDPLAWVDADRLVLSYSVYRGGDGDDEMSQSSGSPGPGLFLWEPSSSSAPTLLPDRWGTSVRATDRAGRLLMMTNRGGRLVSVDDPRSGRPVAVRGSYMVGDLALASDGSVAWPRGNRHPNRLTVVAPGGTASVVPGSGRTFAGVAWLDERHVAATRRLGSGYRRVALFRMDVRTGESSVLLEYPQQRWGPDIGLATDLLSVPTVDRPLPPEPMSPRLTTGLSAAVLLGGLTTFLLWRRRVRP